MVRDGLGCGARGVEASHGVVHETKDKRGESGGDQEACKEEATGVLVVLFE